MEIAKGVSSNFLKWYLYKLPYGKDINNRMKKVKMTDSKRYKSPNET